MKYLFKKPKIRIFKTITITFAILLLVITANYYINYKYSSITNEFFSKFNSCNFTEAKKIITSDNIFLKLKNKTLSKDLNIYFSSIVENICDSVLDNYDDTEKALIVLNEIKSYNVLNCSLNKVIISLDANYQPKTETDYEALLDLGVNNYDNGDFDVAISYLSKIPDTSTHYNNSIKYMY